MPSEPRACANAAAQKRRIVRLANDDLGFRPFLLQHPCNALERAARAHAGDPIVKPVALEVLENFDGGGLGMEVRVRFVLELPAEEPAMGLRELQRLGEHSAAFFGGRRQDDLGPQETHELAPFDAEILRHRDDERIAFLRADHGKTDAGVAAGRLDDGLSRLQLAAAFCRFDHAQRQPVLDGPERIESFQLDEQLHPGGASFATLTTGVRPTVSRMFSNRLAMKSSASPVHGSSGLAR